MKLTKNYLFFLLLLLLLVNNCAKVDPVTGEKILIEPNVKTKSENAAKDGKGIFGDISIGKKSASVFDFATSNVLWRATLKSLEFMPLINADYSGGIVVYDWYAENLNSNEQIKVSIRFLNNEIRSDSIEVLAYKKICEINNKCMTTSMDKKFSNEIKDKILFSARQMKIEESKKENK
jgi:hypothetical protein